MIRAMIALAVFTLFARADEAWSGNRLYAACQLQHTVPSDCDVFIRGVIDRYHEFIASLCAPQHVSFDEIVERIVADLEANRSTRNEPAAHLILDSIGRAYGCRP